MIAVDDRQPDVTPAATLDYIADMTTAMVGMAERREFKLLAYLLKVARAEADQLSKGLNGIGPTPPSGTAG